MVTANPDIYKVKNEDIDFILIGGGVWDYC